MTCIGGLVARDGTIWMAGDSAGVGGLSLRVRADPKVFEVGGFLFGFTQSFRMGQVLRHCFTPPERKPDQDLEGYLIGPFVDAVRQCFKDKGYLYKNNEREWGGTFLLGHAGRLFRVEEDFQVGESRCGFDAVGCGADIAVGALTVAKGAPEKRLRAALTAAEQFSAGVRGPFIVKKLKRR